MRRSINKARLLFYSATVIWGVDSRIQNLSGVLQKFPDCANSAGLPKAENRKINDLNDFSIVTT
jgi:hypothetical protein